MFVVNSPNLSGLSTYVNYDLFRARLFTFLGNSPPNLINTQLLFVNMSLADVLPRDSRFSVTGLEKESKSWSLRCLLPLLCDVIWCFGSLLGEWE